MFATFLYDYLHIYCYPELHIKMFIWEWFAGFLRNERQNDNMVTQDFGMFLINIERRKESRKENVNIKSTILVGT